MDITRNLWKYYHSVVKYGNFLLEDFLRETTVYFEN